MRMFQQNVKFLWNVKKKTRKVSTKCEIIVKCEKTKKTEGLKKKKKGMFQQNVKLLWNVKKGNISTKCEIITKCDFFVNYDFEIL